MKPTAGCGSTCLFARLFSCRRTNANHMAWNKAKPNLNVSPPLWKFFFSPHCKHCRLINKLHLLQRSLHSPEQHILLYKYLVLSSYELMTYRYLPWLRFHRAAMMSLKIPHWHTVPAGGRTQKRTGATFQEVNAGELAPPTSLIWHLEGYSAILIVNRGYFFQYSYMQSIHMRVLHDYYY